MANNNAWLTKAQAAARLGVSVRTLERHAKAGRVQTGKREGARTRTGVKTEVVFDAQSIDAFKAKREEASDPILKETQGTTTGSTSLARRDDSRNEAKFFELLEALTKAAGGPAMLTPGAGKAASVPIADKLTLSLREAAALAGFSRAYLLAAITAGELRAEKRAGKWNMKRSDLEAWVTKL